MAYDQGLAQRIRVELGQFPEMKEQKMFGGVGYLIRGNMACGVQGDELIIRVGPDQYEQALSEPHTRPFDMTGRPMSGWIMVAPPGFEAEDDFKHWVKQGIEFASSLPAK